MRCPAFLGWHRAVGPKAGHTALFLSFERLKMSFKTLAKVGLIAGAIIGAVVAAEATDISGAGATFPYPIYSKWAAAYKTETGDSLNYQSIGSGGGIKQIE